MTRAAHREFRDVLDEATHTRVVSLCREGDSLAAREDFAGAVAKYREAHALLPPPAGRWEAATWIYTAIGDALFHAGDYQVARTFLHKALTCPNGLGNAFVHLRLGQTQYEVGNLVGAQRELSRAYAVGGKRVFEGDDPKYLAFAVKALKPK